jgi:hypothetical protein
MDNKKKEEYEIIKKERAYYNMYIKIVCRNGLPYILLKNTIQRIEQEANKILGDITNFRIRIKQQYGRTLIWSQSRSGNSIEIYKEENDKIIKIESTSPQGTRGT